MRITHYLSCLLKPDSKLAGSIPESKNGYRSTGVRVLRDGQKSQEDTERVSVLESIPTRATRLDSIGGSTRSNRRPEDRQRRLLRVCGVDRPLLDIPVQRGCLEGTLGTGESPCTGTD